MITGTTFGVKVAEGSVTATATGTSGTSGSSLASKHYGSVSWTLVLGALAATLLGGVAVL